MSERAERLEDALDRSELIRPGAGIGHWLTVKQSTGSTNDDARLLAEDGALHGSVVLAEHQQGGRGRLSRTWHSPFGANLLFSVILRPGAVGLVPGLLTAGAGVAVARAVSGLCGVPARIKWPNDVLVSGRKLAGILAEAGGEGAIDYVVLGIGLNVNLSAEAMPADLKEIASSLYIESGRRWSRAAVYVRVLEELEEVLALIDQGRRNELFEAWSSLCEAFGKRVRADTPGGVIEGIVAGIGDDGALLVRDLATGLVREVVAGDVTVI